MKRVRMKAVSVRGGIDKRGLDSLVGPFLLRAVHPGHVRGWRATAPRQTPLFLPLVFSIPRKVQMNTKDSEGDKGVF